MGQSIGELLDEPVEYWNWTQDSAARLAAVHAVQDLSLLDHIGPQPTSMDEVAASCGGDLGLIRRLIEFLAAEGVLKVDAEGKVLSTERSRKLQSIGGVAWTYGTLLASTQHLGEAIRQGGGAYPWAIAYGKPIFEAFSENPDWADKFGQAMSFSTSVTEPRIFELHRFQPFKLAVDVGGSHGNLMIRLLGQYPNTRGIVFDLPETAEQAKAVITNANMEDRIEAVGGSFFEKIPEGGDLYLLKHILHDWSDAESIAILNSIRAAMKPGKRLAVLERIVPDEYKPDVAYSYDMVMMLCTTGKERRIGDFEAMFGQAGFNLDRVTNNPGGVSVIEAVAI